MISLALRQLWREPRVTAVLLAAVALVTSFAALAPLYVRMVSAAELDVRITTLTPRQQRLELSSDAPLNADVMTPFEDALGEIVRSSHRFMFAPTRYCPLVVIDPPRPHYVPCIRQFTYPDLSAEFIALEGRLPQSNPDILEVALTAASLDKAAQMQADFQFAVGERYQIGGSGLPLLDVELVGIVDPIIPEGNPHWDGQETIFGAIIHVQDFAPDELDLGLLVHPDVFETGFDSSGARQYVVRANLDLADVQAGELDALGRRMDVALASIRSQNPTIDMFSPVSVLIADFQARLAEVGKPVLLLVALTMVLLLYTLVTTGMLILDRSRTAWAQMAGRGGSARQLILLHAFGMAILGVLAGLFSVPLAYGFALALAALGPQAGVVQYPSLSDLPAESFVYGGAAALLAVAALVLPGIPSAFTSFARLRSETGRPVSRPLWARYYVDVVLSGLGLAFVLRARGADLSDPFNLAGPALLLTGAALLWLRVFPVLMRLAGVLVGLFNNLGLRLAFWGLERDPGSSGQLVMMVVGALALGTASLVLTELRGDTAWDAARGAIAADVRLSLDPALAIPGFDYSTLPGVTAADQFVEFEGGPNPGPLQAVLVGYVDPAAAAIAPLAGSAYEFAGVLLPADAARVALDVYSEPSDPPTDVRVTLEITNRDQLRLVLPLGAPDTFTSGEWTTYSATLDSAALGLGPYRITGIAFPSFRPEGNQRFSELGRFDHTLYVANLRAETAAGPAVPLADLMADPEAILARPVEGADMRSNVLSFGASTEIPAPDGGPSLRVLYNRNTVVSERSPLLHVLTTDDPVPVLITQRYADLVGDRSALRRPLQVGDTLPSEFPDPHSPFQRLRLEYTVVGIVPAPAPYAADQSMLLTRADWLLSQLNRRRSNLESGTGINRVSLVLADREPPADLRAAVAALPGVTAADYAYDRFAALQRAPLANAVTGMLFAGFCAAFGLIVLQAGFYTAVTLRRRAGSFAVLRSLGWGAGDILRMLAVEQTAIVAPALGIGVLVGAGLAALLLPLLGVGGAVLRLPLAQVIGLLATIGVLFAALLVWSAKIVRGVDVAQQVRAVD
jgi:hypothetical protein